MVIRMRHTRSHRDNRRAHHALTGANLVICPECSSKMRKHTACPNCGKYKKREVLNVNARIEKKEEKRKKRAKETGEAKK
jgi:large subunit ribosomal protein L32